MSSQNRVDVAVKVAGQDLDENHIFDWTVEADMDHPDMAIVALSNAASNHSDTAKVGDPVEVLGGWVNEGGNAQATVFKGEVVSVEPVFASGRPARVVLRCLNQLHKLTRGKKSKTFTNMTDKDIMSKIAQEAGLTPEYDGPQTKYDHVFQHNQTDLEFLRKRATRVGCELLVEDKKLKFRKRQTTDSGIELTLSEAGAATLEKFSPKMSTAHQVSKVVVRSWDPKKKKLITGEAKAQSSALGSTTGSAATEDAHSGIAHVDVDVPFATQEEADNAAKAILADRLMGFIIGDATAKGNAAIKPGIVVKINVGSGRFDGKYYIASVRHRYVHEGPEHGFRTHFKFRRDAEGTADGATGES